MQIFNSNILKGNIFKRRAYLQMYFVAELIMYQSINVIKSTILYKPVTAIVPYGIRTD